MATKILLDLVAKLRERREHDVLLRTVRLQGRDRLLDRFVEGADHLPGDRRVDPVVLPQQILPPVDHEVQHPAIRGLEHVLSEHRAGDHHERVDVHVHHAPCGLREVRRGVEEVAEAANGTEGRARAVPDDLLDEPGGEVGVLREGLAAGVPAHAELLLADRHLEVRLRHLPRGPHAVGQLLEVLEEGLVVGLHLLLDRRRQRRQGRAELGGVVLLARALLLRDHAGEAPAEEEPREDGGELHREVRPAVALANLLLRLRQVVVEQAAGEEAGEHEVGRLVLEEQRHEAGEARGVAVGADEALVVEELEREARVVRDLRLQLRLGALEEGQAEERRQAPGDVRLRPRHLLARQLVQADLLPLMEDPQEGRGRQRELAREGGEVRRHEALDLEVGHVQEDDLAQEVEAAAPGAPGHLAVHEAAELQGVAAEDGGAARHVDSQGERARGEDDAEVAATEEDLDGLPVLLLRTLVVHADAAAQAVHQVRRQVLPGGQGLHRLLDVLRPLAQGLRAVEGELHVDLVGEVDDRGRLRHGQGLRDVGGLALAGAAALVVARRLAGRRALLVLARQGLLRLLVGGHLVGVIGLTLRHDLLGAEGGLLGAVVLVVLLVLELVHEPLEHALDVLAGEVEDDRRQVLQLVQRADKGDQRGGLHVRSALLHLRDVHGPIGHLGRLGLLLLDAARRLELRDGLSLLLDVDDGARHPLQRHLELVEDLGVDGPVLHELEEGGLQLLLPFAGLLLLDEGDIGEVGLRRQLVPGLVLAQDLGQLLEELHHLLRGKGQVRGEALQPHVLLHQAAEGVQRLELALLPVVLVEVVPALGVDHDLDLGRVLLRVHLRQPAVEEGRVRHRGRQRDEGAGDGLHRVLPLRAVLAADAVDLVEDDVPQALHPVLVTRGGEEHLQDVRDGDQHLAVLPLPGLEGAAAAVVLPREHAQQLALAVCGVGLAGEARVDLRADLVHQRLRGGDVDRNALVVRAEDLVHHVVSDEGLAAGRRRDDQRGAVVVHDVEQVHLPLVRLEVHASLRILGRADGTRHVGAQVPELPRVLLGAQA
mmetsp:Transcript_60675/g.177960  ORF Transcript_60675/g.177960 Transcript_60675/m.177960 type:complete len:1051 (+) Transcript_60675:106-3258(+)